MSEHPTFDAAQVFSLISDPQYNALRLHLMLQEVNEIRLNLNEAKTGTASGSADNADVVRRSERA